MNTQIKTLPLKWEKTKEGYMAMSLDWEYAIKICKEYMYMYSLVYGIGVETITDREEITNKIRQIKKLKLLCEENNKDKFAELIKRISVFCEL